MFRSICAISDFYSDANKQRHSTLIDISTIDIEPDVKDFPRGLEIVEKFLAAQIIEVEVC